jgi:hypothetical protein
VASQGASGNLLPSWRESATKRTVLEFLAATSIEGSPDFVPPTDRLATFDNDGTLWVEQPIYTQAVFAFARVRALGPRNPGWATQEPFRSVIAGDMAGIACSGQKGLAEVIAATHTA